MKDKVKISHEEMAFDHLMRCLVQVPKEELDKALADEKRLKMKKPDQPKRKAG